MLERVGAKDLQQIVKNYLQMGHRDGNQMHCPLAFMVSDASRQDEAIRSSYTQVFTAFIARLEAGLEPTTTNTRQQALQIAVGMIRWPGLSMIATGARDPDSLPSRMSTAYRALNGNAAILKTDFQATCLPGSRHDLRWTAASR
ncbi:hypothetical protein [Azomonas macrocytogenes]|uniref:TetR family transcriptional regulator n=1 Tax=Azomonas macrocytogenes TaxID=69962 RepID=A0A839T1A7_AZOMA|nr:hypothetical protein [Azomonas macrocytogenes]MBB3102184.1 hypothetical protein [Azomonas macrocytogenes]